MTKPSYLYSLKIITFLTFKVDLHLSCLHQLKQDTVWGQTSTQNQVCSQPSHAWNPGCLDQFRIQADHREQKVSAGTKSGVWILWPHPGPTEEGRRLSGRRQISNSYAFHKFGVCCASRVFCHCSNIINNISFVQLFHFCHQCTCAVSVGNEQRFVCSQIPILFGYKSLVENIECLNFYSLFIK